MKRPKYKPKFRGQDFYLKMKMKDGEVIERKVFANSETNARKVAKRQFNGINGLSQIKKVKHGTKWYR